MRKNFLLKAASFLLAVVVWFSVITKVQSSATYEVAVDFKNIPKGVEIADPPDVIAVTVRGPERLIKNLDSSNIGVNLDMGKAKKGRHRYNIDNKAVSLPALMHLVELGPSSIVVDMEDTRSKTLAVGAPLRGAPAKGFRVVSVEISPKDVTIEGAASRIEKVASLSTEPVDIENASASVEKDAALALPEGIRASAYKARVKVVVGRR